MDLSVVIESLRDSVAAFLASLPQIVAGLVVLAIFYYLSRPVRGLIDRALGGSGMSAQGAQALARIARWGVIIGGVLIAMAIMFPSIQPGDLLSTLGIGGVALGFAFRDILQNFFAGLILLLTEPFAVGDQIEVAGYAGTVKRVETRATTLHTYDGRDVIIPNAELFTESVTVNTAHNKRRSEYDVGIGYGDDIARAKEIIHETMRGIDGVLDDPPVQVYVVDLADFTTNLRVRWWTEPEKSDVMATQDVVLSQVRDALVGAGVDLPFPTQQILFHDQTESTDGDRARQREGWPAAPEDNPEQQRIVDAIRTNNRDQANGAA